MKSIGIIGVGFVGGAVWNGMNHVFDVWGYDKKWGNRIKHNNNFIHPGNDYTYPARPESEKDSVRYVSKEVDGPIILCLPTPMHKDGSCNTDIIEDVVSQINGFGTHKILVIKSTVVPGTTDRLSEKYKNVSICFCPEFLTERSADKDFQNQSFIIIGGKKPTTKTVKLMFQKAYPGVPCYLTDANAAEMMKYARNCYLATKVAFANEIYRVCEKTNIDYDKVCELLWNDPAVGKTHWSVPGHDGKMGFGGKCFSKDMNAILQLGVENGIQCHTMLGAWATNLEVRPERDWEEIEGVITKEEK